MSVKLPARCMWTVAASMTKYMINDRAEIYYFVLNSFVKRPELFFSIPPFYSFMIIDLVSLVS